MTATEIVAFPTTLLVDSRNTCLRATWHAAENVVVFSHWRDGACASTFQLANQDVARLTSFLVDVLGVTSTVNTTVEESTTPRARGWRPRARRARTQ
ncbi:MAG: hypothetical protein ABIP21_07700 [Acidimicrobiia bacterium]